MVEYDYGDAEDRTEVWVNEVAKMAVHRAGAVR